MQINLVVSGVNSLLLIKHFVLFITTYVGYGFRKCTKYCQHNGFLFPDESFVTNDLLKFINSNVMRKSLFKANKNCLK